MDNLTDRVILANAKILENLGEDPNTFAKKIPDLFEAKDWNYEKEILAGKKRAANIKKGTKRKRCIIAEKSVTAMKHKEDMLDNVKEAEKIMMKINQKKKKSKSKIQKKSKK